MRTVKPATRATKIFAVPVLAGMVAWAASTGSAAAVMGRPVAGGTATPFTVNGILDGVAATSASNAWATGDNGSGGSLIVHWNGTAWKQVPSPSPSDTANFLNGVAATSASNAWAVGSFITSVNLGGQPLIAHWNGSAWKHMAGPNPGDCFACPLYGVAATSASDAWAVGYTDITGNSQSLIVHWNGTAWKRVPSPDPSPSSDVLYGAAATSASDAWAVGSAIVSGVYHSLVVHWNGSAWTQVPSPALGGPLYGVAAISASDAWAVGSLPGGGTLTLHWNGTAWTQVPSPNPSGSVILFAGVAATSASDVWAAGTAGSNTLIAHWNGTAWKQVPSPNPSAPVHTLNGVAATSTTNAWAVGNTSAANGTNPKTLIARWNGTTWKQS
jgi:hypothetical protein